MHRFPAILPAVCVVAVLCFGCSSSEQTESQSPSPPVSTLPTSGEMTKKSDTLSVDAQNTSKPVYNPAPVEKVVPAVRYSVQVGAYKMADNAERIASLARERFGKNVFTFPDRVNDLYKVMVGDFTMKDDARRFRDEMVQKYPTDYKDAWVAEMPPQ